MLRAILALIKQRIRLHLRNLHLSAPAIGVGGLSRHEQAAPRFELRLEEWLVEPCDLCEARAVADECRQNRHAPPARLLFRDICNHPGNRRALTDDELRDWRDRALILVASWVICQEVIERHDAELLQQFCLFRPDALETLNGIEQLHRSPLSFLRKTARPSAAGL